MHYWLHRISHHAEISHPLLEKGYLSIGFSDFSEQEFIDDILEANSWDTFESYMDDIWGDRPRTRFSLWRFVAEMKKGDWVLVPSWGTFSIYELIGDKPETVASVNADNVKDWHGHKLHINEKGLLSTEKEGVADLGFIWKVKPIEKNIARYEYADAALTSRMKIRNTNADISDLKESIERSVKFFKENKPINIYSQIISKTGDRILNTIQSELNENKFESLVKWYFQRIGASEVSIPAKNESGKEGDADVVAVFEPIRTIIYTQVKFHKGSTSEWAIEQILEYKEQKELSMDDGYSKQSWVITSADKYSKEAYELAKENNVQLVDGTQFVKMLLDIGFVNLDKAI